MKWYDCKEKLPPILTKVMVCRVIRVESCNIEINVHDIGVLKGKGMYDRWELESQEYAPLPLKPTLQSGIVTHWAHLPKLPDLPKKGEEECNTTL